jgi:trans-aconitate 3-methyltransferase
MSQSAPTPTPFPTEKTFSSYNQEQGKAYAQIRRDYHPSLYQTIISHHTSTGGQLDTLLDVGCGPGIAARGLDSHFAHAIGIDPSEGMIATARSLGGVTSTSEPVRFEVSTAEDLGGNLSPPIQDSSVDLITASNAAHWFDMSRFWPSAARVLKPGGSVALWTSGELSVHPSMPNAAAIQASLDQIQEQHLKPYYAPGNLLTRNRYVDLPLPWTLAQPVPEFDESTFFRKDWDVAENFFVGQPEVDLDTFEKMMGTASTTTRWRQAHPDAVGTERDVVRMLRREIERLLHEAGVEKGKETVKGAMQGTLLMVKKKI